LQRSKKPIETTGELVDVVLSVVKRSGKVHPATKVFQAIRIEVNKELEHLKVALWKVPRYLKKGGRLVVISSTPWRTGSLKISSKSMPLSLKFSPRSRLLQGGKR
jgi:16S rRNA C1402 N4-methylase RsmH